MPIFSKMYFRKATGGDTPSITIPTSFTLNGSTVSAPSVTSKFSGDVYNWSGIGTTKLYRSFTTGSDGAIRLTSSINSNNLTLTHSGAPYTTYVVAGQVGTVSAAQYKFTMWLYQSDENGVLTPVKNTVSSNVAGSPSAQSKTISVHANVYGS